MPLLDKNEMKRITKEALKEWLDEKFMQFGKWSIAAFASMLLASLLYFVLKMNGWHQ